MQPVYASSGRQRASGSRSDLDDAEAERTWSCSEQWAAALDLSSEAEQVSDSVARHVLLMGRDRAMRGRAFEVAAGGLWSATFRDASWRFRELCKSRAREIIGQ
ncbi:hypothetical protein PYCC9005_002948 [Savitreella phatthalungensis]